MSHPAAASPALPPLRMAIAGASGRMGRMLVEAVTLADDMVLHAVLDAPGGVAIGIDATAHLGQRSGVLISDDPALALRGADCLIDFTRPEGTMAHLAVCRELGVNLVIGTTGLDDAHRQRIHQASQDIGIVLSPNMAVGVNVVMHLLAQAAKALNQGYDIEIIETHHRHKVDAPSGTALKMGEVVAKTLGRDLKTCAVYGREGVTGERDPQTIGFATVRGGDVVGDHTVLFAGIGERIEITHKSSSRSTYAQGSLRAARYLRQHPKGLFDMDDVLGLAG